MKSTMIIVADSARARVFTFAADRSELVEIDDLAHPEGRLHDREITSDLPGKDIGGTGSGGHTHEEKVSPVEHELSEFARRIAHYLDDARKANKLSKLMLLAAPAFLGELRSQFSAELKKLIVFELDKNLAKMDVADIKKHLPKPSTL